MTRDQAIKAVCDALSMKDFCLIKPASLVDALAALGVLKLDEQKRRDAYQDFIACLRSMGLTWREVGPQRIMVNEPVGDLKRYAIENTRPAGVLVEYGPPERDLPPSFHYCVPPKENATAHWHLIRHGDTAPVRARWHGDQLLWDIGLRTMTVDQATEDGWYYVGMSTEPLQSTRCEPPPEHREKRWHWIIGIGLGFDPAVVSWIHGEWRYVDDRSAIGRSPENAASVGWRYVAPCEEPKQASAALKVGIARKSASDD